MTTRRAPAHQHSQPGSSYLLSQSPWKCTGDQANTGWTACAVLTFLPPGQSNNIRPWRCSKASPGPRSLCWVHSAERKVGGMGTWGQLDEICLYIQKSLSLQCNAVKIGIDNNGAIENVASVLLEISGPPFSSSVQQNVDSRSDELRADADKIKAPLNSWEAKHYILINAVISSPFCLESTCTTFKRIPSKRWCLYFRKRYPLGFSLSDFCGTCQGLIVKNWVIEQYALLLPLKDYSTNTNSSQLLLEFHWSHQDGPLP